MAVRKPHSNTVSLTRLPPHGESNKAFLVLQMQELTGISWHQIPIQTTLCLLLWAALMPWTRLNGMGQPGNRPSPIRNLRVMTSTGTRGLPMTHGLMRRLTYPEMVTTD